MPAVFVIASGIIVLNQIFADPLESASGLLLVAVGLPIYYIWIRRQHSDEGAPTGEHH